MVISRMFWPTFEDTKYKMPDFVSEWRKRYEASFKEIKASRKLEWLSAEGAVDLEVVNSKQESLRLIVTPIQATVLLLFKDRGLIFKC